MAQRQQAHQSRQPQGDDEQEEEETVYVMLDLQGLEQLPPGSTLQLKGLDSGMPVLQLPDGTQLAGVFQETVGTQLVLGDELEMDGSHRVQLVCHTDKRISFSQPVQPASTHLIGEDELFPAARKQQQQQQGQQEEQHRKQLHDEQLQAEQDEQE